MRIAVFCPGRGAYTKRDRSTLPQDHPHVVRAEELRAEYGLTPLLELDRSPRWRSSVQLRPDNVSPLIYTASLIDAAQALEEHEALCAGGNSMGWYTALAVAGALDFEDGFRLVQEMSLLQMEQSEGGQVVYPLIDERWRIDERYVRRVDEALASAEGEAFPSIALGGYAVLAGTERGIEHLLEALTPIEMGPQIFPYRLKQHGPYHTPLLHQVANKAAAQLGRLEFRRPKITLVDGRGVLFSPWSTDPEELRAYTLGRQIRGPFSFTASVRVALREFAPERLALLGPGNTLGGVCGQILVMEGYRGITSREDFDRVQESDDPVVWSMRR